MAITSDLLRISVRGLYLGQQVQVIQPFICGGAGLLTANCAGVAEAFWEEIKDDWRSCHGNDSNDKTLSVLCEEIGGSLGFGEYPIPPGEQLGTRDTSGLAGLLPPFVAVAVRLTVATRVTRPGQKRFWGVYEADQALGVFAGPLFTAYETLMDTWTLPIGLSAPADIVQLEANVVHFDRVTGEPGARQDVTGYLINQNLSTQNSRKFGRGI